MENKYCKKDDCNKCKKPDIINSLYQVENFLCKIKQTCKVISIKKILTKK